MGCHPGRNKSVECLVDTDFKVNASWLMREKQSHPEDLYVKIDKLDENSWSVRNKITGHFRQMTLFIEEASFRREVELLRDIDHVNVVKIYDFFSFEGKFWMVTEFCKEYSLKKLRKTKVFDDNLLIRISKQILSALIYCHNKGIVHGNLNESTILFSEGEDVKLIGLVNKSVQTTDLKALSILLVELSTTSSKITDLADFLQTSDISALNALSHPLFNKVTIKRSETLRSTYYSAYKSLVQYKPKNKLREASLAFILRHLSKREELNTVKQIFLELDANRDGKLVKQDFAKFFKSQNDKNFDLNASRTVSSLDKNKSNSVEFEEFTAGALEMNSFFTDSNLKFVFDFFDLDSDGFLSKEDLTKSLRISKANKQIWTEILGEYTFTANKLDFQSFTEIIK